MKIQRIAMENLLGVRRMTLAVKTPVCLVAGRNGAGKSSTYEGIKMALAAEPPRGMAARDFGLAISEGAKAGSAHVDTDSGPYSFDLAVSHPKMAWSTPGGAAGSPVLPFVLDAQRFARLPLDEQRTFLSRLCGGKPPKQEVMERMQARGFGAEQIAGTVAMLTAGFPAAHEAAKRKQAEARGAWRALTGEVYGSKKADSWQAPCPPADSAAQQQVADTLAGLEQALAEAQQQLGALAAQAPQPPALRPDAGALVHALAAMLADLRWPAEHGGRWWQQQLPAIDALLERYAQQYGAQPAAPAAAADGPDHAAAMAALREKIADLGKERDAARRLLDMQLAAQLATANAGQLTERARLQHLEAQSWGKVAELLAPDGIPAELLAQALRPLNDLLRASASATGWMQVALGPELAITAGGRPYPLLSESEQWRTDAMLACALAQLSGVRLLLLDRFDVLDLPARAECLLWLDALAHAGALDTVLLFGTLKALPTGLPKTITAVWVADGRLADGANQEKEP